MRAGGSLVLAALLLASAVAAEPQVVTVHAVDEGFVAPERVPSGLTAFDFVNKGWKPHRMVLLRFAADATPESLAAISLDRPLPDGVEALGGSDVHRPEGGGRTLVSLEPGLHALLCDLVDEGQHGGKPWIQPLEVLAYNEGALPAGDATIGLLEDGIRAPDVLAPGALRLRVERHGLGPRGLVVYRLRHGRSHADGSAWLRTRAGRSPLIRVLGAAPLSPGRALVVPASLAAGDYLLHATGPADPETRPLRVASPR